MKIDDLLHSSMTNLIQEILSRVNILHANHAVIQSQPNGFMRLALDDQQNSQSGWFLHIWQPNLPVQKYIHTHVFDLTSKVLLGSIQDYLYQHTETEGGIYRILESKCTQNDCTILSQHEKKYDLSVTRKKDLMMGDLYQIPKNTFHSTALVSREAITLMKKTNLCDENPLLAIPISQSVSLDPFSRAQLDQRSAWTATKDLLNFSLKNLIDQ